MNFSEMLYAIMAGMAILGILLIVAINCLYTQVQLLKAQNNHLSITSDRLNRMYVDLNLNTVANTEASKSIAAIEQQTKILMENSVDGLGIAKNIRSSTSDMVKQMKAMSSGQ